MYYQAEETNPCRKLFKSSKTKYWNWISDYHERTLTSQFSGQQIKKAQQGIYIWVTTEIKGRHPKSGEPLTWMDSLILTHWPNCANRMRSGLISRGCSQQVSNANISPSWNGFASMVQRPWSYTNNYRSPILLYASSYTPLKATFTWLNVSLMLFLMYPHLKYHQAPWALLPKQIPTVLFCMTSIIQASFLLMEDTSVQPNGLPPSSPLNRRRKGSIHNGYLDLPWTLVTLSPISQEMLIEQLDSLGPVLGLHDPPSPTHLPFLDLHSAL